MTEPTKTAAQTPATRLNVHIQPDRSKGPLRSQGYSTLPTPPRARVHHACDRCRITRSKCSGGTRCSRCVKNDTVCTYSDRKGDQTKKSLIQRTDRVQQLTKEKASLAEALKDIISTSAISTEKLENAVSILSKLSSDDDSRSVSVTSSQSYRTTSLTPSSPGGSKEVPETGEKTVLAEVGSPGHQGELKHILNLSYGAGMTGHVGKMSEMSWMQRAREHLVGQPIGTSSDETPLHVDHHSAQAADLTYFMDDEDLLSVDEDHVVPDELPPNHIVLTLSEAYFHAVQGAFQFIEREKFLRELENLLKRPDLASWSQRRTLALSNLVWAVGAKWVQITQLSEEPLLTCHLVYYARARALGLDHRIVFDHPDVEMIRGIGILGFYLLINGSIQRAWNIIGQAVRHAVAVGLNLHVITGSIDATEQMKRVHLWYSLFQIESLLSELTGRSKCIHAEDVTLTLAHAEHGQLASETYIPGIGSGTDQDYARIFWRSFLGVRRGIALSLSGGQLDWDRFVPVGSSFSPRYFVSRSKLSIISDAISIRLYSGTSKLTWFEHQTATHVLEEELQNWHNSLPEDLRLEYHGQGGADPRSRLDLAMYRQSLRMILFRPFLCEIRIENESVESINFNKACAKTCVEAALEMLSIIPDNAVATEVLQILPWWSLLHYVCQAAAILLLELCLNMQHMQGDLKVVLSAVRKALSYLWAFSANSKSAYKAWNILRLLFERSLTPYQNTTLSDVPDEAPVPRNWDANNATMMEAIMRTLW